MPNITQRTVSAGLSTRTGTPQPATQNTGANHRFGRPNPVRAPVVNSAPAATTVQSQLVYHGAMMKCECGRDFTHLVVAPASRAANIYDAVPHLNIPAFGLCTSLKNPVALGAAAASFQRVSAVPCAPVTQCWSNGSATDQVQGAAALQMSSHLQCSWGGKITLLTSGF